MRNLRPPTTRPTSDCSQIDQKLATCTHVFVRNENRRGLMPNYSGPYKVIERNSKHFTIRLDNKDDKVSIDRLKSAKLDLDSNPPTEDSEEEACLTSPQLCAPANPAATCNPLSVAPEEEHQASGACAMGGTSQERPPTPPVSQRRRVSFAEDAVPTSSGTTTTAPRSKFGRVIKPPDRLTY